MRNLILFFGLMFLFNSTPSEAFLFNKAPTLKHLSDSPELMQLLKDIQEQPDTLKDADKRVRLIYPMPQGEKELSADLVLTDIMDQVHFYLDKKNEKEIIKKLKVILGSKPLENFLKWNQEIEKLSPTNKNLRRAISKVVVQLYDVDGTPRPFKLDIFRSGRFSRYERQRRANQYAELQADPEGIKILRFITTKRQQTLDNGSDLGVYPTTRPTVSKYLVHKKYFNNDLKEEYYENYFKLIYAQEAIDHKNLPANSKVDFKYKFKASRSKPLLIKAKFGSEKEFKAETAQLFNTIHSLPHKEQLLLYLKSELEEKFNVKVPAVTSMGMDHILLTPSFIHLHRKKMIPMIKEFTYVYLFSHGDMEYFLHLRKWVKHNYKDITKKAVEKGLTFTIPHRLILLPHVAEVVENFSVMTQLYPDLPWDKKLPVVYDRNGNPVYLKGAGIRFILKARDYLKKLASIENVSSVVVGGLVYAATGNPMLSGMAGSLVRDAVAAVKYDLRPEQFLPSMLRNVAISAIIGAGFSSGRLAEQIILGALAGAAESAIINRRVDVGAIVGAIQGILTGLLPRGIAHPTIAGLTKDVAFKNALIELLETSVYRGIHGLVVSAVTKEDMLEGLGKGLLYGLGEGGLKIAIYGFRYVPSVTQEDLDAENAFQRGQGPGSYELDMKLVDDTFFRRGGLFEKFYKRTWTWGNTIMTDEQTPGNVGVESHEMSHRAQNRSFGIIGFNTRYVLEFFRNGSNGTAAGGGNVFEHYRYINHSNCGTCPEIANLGNSLGMRAFDTTLGTTGGVRTTH